jgi:hypothetical protein
MEFRRLVTLTVTNHNPVNSDNELLASGVPIAPGKAPEGSSLVLRDRRGRPLPGTADVTARWADGSAKWVWVTVPHLSLGAGKSSRITLGLGEAAAGSAITVKKSAKGVSVSTGRIRFRAATTGVLVPGIEVRTRDGWRKRAIDLDLTMLIDHDGVATEYRASLAPREIEVETATQTRVVLCVRGTHGSAQGEETFGPYTLRMEAVADNGQVRLSHSFVYDGDPERDVVRGSELRIRAIPGDDQRFAFGGDEGAEVAVDRQRASWAQDFRVAELYQDSATHWRVSRRIAPELPEVFCAEGLQTDGWFALSGQKGSVAVAVRDGWQNHPKSLWADAETGEMVVGLYPRRAAGLDLRRYSDLVHAHTYESPCTWKEETLPFSLEAPARGVRKTHDLMLMVDEPNPSARALFYNQPLVLTWSQSHLAATGAVVPAAAKTDPDWTATIHEYLDFTHDEMLACGGTGYVDYFDLPHGYDVANQRWFHDFGGFGYINDEAMPCLGLWQAWLLTGRPDALAMARAMTRHNADFDCRHLGPMAGYGSRHNVNHWGCECYDRRVSMPLGKRLAYHVMGDRSVIDLARLTYESFVTGLDPARKCNTTCDVPALVASLLFLDEIGDTDSEAWLRLLADALAAAIDASGRMPAFMTLGSSPMEAEPVENGQVMGYIMFSCFGGPQAFCELAERYDHQPLRDALVRLARYQIMPKAERDQLTGKQPEGFGSHKNNLYRGLDLIGYAWQVTRDPIFPESVREMLEHRLVRIENHPDTRYGVVGAGTRAVPVGHMWSDRTESEDAAQRRHYPLFQASSQGQFFNIAVYLHKLQGVMALLAEE